MIILFHKNNKVTKVLAEDKSQITYTKNKTIAFVMMQLALKFQNEKIIWCDENNESSLNLREMNAIMHHNKIMVSYNSTANNYLGSTIGYIENSPFININKKVNYPTWQMSSVVGCIHTSVLLAFNDKIKLDADFDYFLNSIAKIGMPLGLICYSEPKLFIKTIKYPASKASIFTVFKFVKQHYKIRWVFLLLVNMMVYEFRFYIFPFIFSLFLKKINNQLITLDAIDVQSNKQVVDTGTVDVIIPTIGREKYLFDVLKDLANQTHLPQNIIIIEQNTDETSISKLDYLYNIEWPFIIKHVFTHQAGACNARNLAINQVENEWVFFADDDIRFDQDLIEKSLLYLARYGANVVSLNCFQKGETKHFNNMFQWSGFGSGCSFVATNQIGKCRFNKGFEFGFGEDSDFGMQLRNLGNDVLFLPSPSILHLKAPIGGFRYKPILEWQTEKIQPKPSPTVMLFHCLHSTPEQLLGYKSTLFLKYYKFQSIKNPIRYLTYFRKQWDKSIYWATILKSKT